MKKKLIISLCILSLIAAGIVFIKKSSLFKEETIYIALAAPMSGPAKIGGEAMFNAVSMYLDQINKKGRGIKGKKIELLVSDDKNDEKTATELAAQIAAEKKALLVIGHLTAPTSMAAGKIYERNEIAAITATAGADSLTVKNKFYFRAIPNNSMQGELVATYISKCLKKTSASIVFIEDDFGISLVQGFESTAMKLGIEIKGKWKFNTGKTRQPEDIAAEIMAMDDPGAVFLALSGAEAAKIAKILKSSGKKYSIMGSSTPAFMQEMNKYPEEKSSPGYYSDGIYAASPFLLDIGNEKTYSFRKEFIKRYGHEPSWVAACTYDAVHLAVEAIRKSDIQGEGHIRKDRRKIRDALTGFYNEKTGIEGITGYLYFNPSRNLNRPYSIGVYENQILFPALSQYQQLTDSKNTVSNIFRRALEGDIVTGGGKIMNKTDIVYTGIEINEISNLNIERSAYTLDFYLWFRYAGEFDDTSIEFINSVNPVKMVQPLGEEKDNGVTVKVYHLKADFKTDFDFHAFPFERHTLSVSFCHTGRTRNSLIYVSDAMGLPRFVKKNSGGPRFISAEEWNIKDMSFYQDVVITSSTLGDPSYFNSPRTISYSRFNAELQIERKGLRFEFLCFLPVIAMLLILYAICLIPSSRLGIRTGIFLTVLISNTAFHLKLLLVLPVEYMFALEYACFAVYGLAVFSALMSTALYIFYRQGSGRKEKVLIYAEKFVFPCLIIGGSFLLFYIFTER
ncbi:MAG: hypothetical protein BWK80_21940 [Desulfobacteraceae bacterium IS3]|nr:MAG: hypothetical protein BWK80_21940 [Desulfobacteraceae bacterium IS3]